nr:hypothetical protein GCM10020092_099230 [Actinoplanes digitatis]
MPAVRADRQRDVQTVVDQAQHAIRAADLQHGVRQFVRLAVADVVLDADLNGQPPGRVAAVRLGDRCGDDGQRLTPAACVGDEVKMREIRAHNALLPAPRHDPDQVRRSGGRDSPPLSPVHRTPVGLVPRRP